MARKKKGADAAPPVRGYAICTVVRSGSTWLTELLRTTEVLGNPNEYFSTDMMQRARRKYPSDRLAQIGLVLSEGMTPNNIYGLKVFPRQFDLLSNEVLWTEHLPNLQFIHLERRDILGQAISRVRAHQTQQWRAEHEAAADPVYDAEEIWQSLRFVARQQARWRLFFGRSGLNPLHLVYEDILKDPQGTVDAIAALVGLDPAPKVNVDLIKIEVQRDETSADWRERFVRRYRDPDHLPPL